MTKTKQNSNNENTGSAAQSNVQKNKNGNVEESGGMTAVIIALVAILLIGGSIGAFFLFVKVKKNYIEPFLNGRAGTALPANLLPPDGGSGGGVIIPAGTGPIGIGDTSPVTPDFPVPPTIPTFPEEPPVTPPTPELPAIPEPEKVGSYDFDGAIAEMDGAMNNTFDTTFSNSLFSNDYFGFD